MSRNPKPVVLIVGGPDVDARLELMRHLSDDFDVSAAGSSPELEQRFSAKGYRFDAYPLARSMHPIADVRTCAALSRLFRRRRPDVVHAFDTKPTVWGPIAARWAGVPAVVTTVTGLGSLYGDRSLTGRLALFGFEMLQRLATRVTDQTIFQNNDDPRIFIDRGLVSEESSSVILGSGVTTDSLAPEKVSPTEIASSRAELGIPLESLVVTMISRVIRSKGVLELAAAARSVGRAHPNARFLLVGPEDEDSMDRLSRDELATLKESVVWAGPRTDVRKILAMSDVFVLPSTLAEGIPRVLLEASSMGLPMVATDAAGCREVVRDGETGFLVPASDPVALERAITRLVEDASLRERFGARARERAVAEFDIRHVAAKTAGVYRRVLDTRSRAINSTR